MAAMLVAWLVAGALQLRAVVPSLPAVFCLTAGGRLSGAASHLRPRAGGGERDLSRAVRVVSATLVGATALGASIMLLARGHSVDGGTFNLAIAWLILSVLAVIASWMTVPNRTDVRSATREWLARRGPHLLLPTLGGEALIAAATAWAAVSMAHTAGTMISPLEAVAAAVVARSLTHLPIPPWGLGVADASLALTLVAIGTPASAALATAALWRSVIIVAWLVSRRAGPLPPTPDDTGPTGSRLGGGFHRWAFRCLSILPSECANHTRRHVFESLFRAARDPWQYGTMPYEQDKRQRLVDSVPPDARTIVEFGCADGHNLLALGARFPGSRIVGIDISPLAVEAARARTAELGNVTVVVADAASAVARLRTSGVLVADALVVAEVLYYLGSPAHVGREMAKLAELLPPGGTVVLLHPVADANNLHAAAAGALGIGSFSRQFLDDPQRPYVIDIGVRQQNPA
jgi:SAM-dependent methyltransferase